MWDGARSCDFPRVTQLESLGRLGPGQAASSQACLADLSLRDAAHLDLWHSQQVASR